MGKTVNELHAMLKLHEETLPKKDTNPALHAIRAGRNNASSASKPKTPPPPKKYNPAKDATCHQCGEVGHWRRNCPVYLAELMKKKKLSHGESTSGALSLYVGYGHRTAVEAIGTFHLELPEVVPFEEQSDNLKKKLAKNNKATMVLYNALFKKEYERIFMCKTAKDICQSLLSTHQGNSQVNNNKIDLLVQQYQQFTILEEETIDRGFAIFNTIITSLKALDEGFSSKNYVRKFFRALHPKWGAKVMTTEESKDLSSLALNELIGN
nr:zinc finger, CCHC-type [Tanacetum cinerariifolium]